VDLFCCNCGEIFEYLYYVVSLETCFLMI